MNKKLLYCGLAVLLALILSIWLIVGYRQRQSAMEEPFASSANDHRVPALTDIRPVASPTVLMGRSLTPSEEKSVQEEMLSDGKQIILGALEYSAKHNNELPSGDYMVDELAKLPRPHDAWRIQKNAPALVHWYHPGEQITSLKPSDIIGNLDAGLGWKIDMRADGICIVAKK